MNDTTTSGKGRTLAIAAVILLAAVIVLQIAILVQRRQDSTAARYAPGRAEPAPTLADRLRAWVSPRAAGAAAKPPVPRWDPSDDFAQMHAQINRLFESAFQEMNPQPPTTPAAASNSTTSGGSAFLFPVQHMQRMQRQIDAMFAGAMNGPHGVGGGFEDGWNLVDVTPSMAVEEGPDAYEIRVHLPGLDRSAIRVSMDGSLLTIQAEAQTTAGAPGSERVTNVTWHVHHASRFERRIRLPEATADHTAIKAVYKDDVLHITVPKADARGLTQDRIKVI